MSITSPFRTLDEAMKLFAVVETAKKEWETTFDAFGEGIGIVRKDGVFKRVNTALASLVGMDVRDLPGCPCCEVLPHHRTNGCPARLTSGHREVEFEIALPWRRVYRESAYVVPGLDSVVVIVTDITPQRINEERIRRLRDEAVTANRELTASLRRLEETQQRLVATEKLASLATMSAGLAHEVNNPLGFVTSGVSCLRDWTAKLMRFVAAFRAGSTKSELDALLRDLALADVATEVEPILADVGVGLDRIKRIVSAFRDFVDGGAAPVEAVDLDTVVRDAVAEAAGTDPDVAVIATPGRTPPVAASSTVARILLDQLLENATFAVKAAGRPGSVSVTTTPRGDRVVLSVADTGVGMDAAVLSRAADPFFTTRAPGPHVGMGLTIAQAVVRRHGGELTLASQPGVGTTVEVSLPAWRDGLSAAEASAGPSSGAAGAAGRT